MTSALHIIDEITPRDCLEQLALLAGRDDAIASIGPSPRYSFDLPVAPVHRPTGLSRLAGKRMRSLAGDADVLHVWSLRALPAGISVAQRLGRKLVLSIPCVPPAFLTGPIRRAVGKGVLHLTVPTEAARRRIVQSGAPVAAVHVLPAAAAKIDDLQERRKTVRAELALTEQDKLLVAPSEMIRYAGHKYASWAHAIVRQVLPNVRLLLPGCGPLLRHVKFFAGTTGYDSEVFLTEDRFSRDDALAAADVALFLCRRDTGISTLVTAMGAGTPIVASATPDMAECAPDGQAALLARPGDPRTASAAVLKLLEDGELARKLAAESSRLAQQRFNLARSRNRLSEIYAALVGAVPA